MTTTAIQSPASLVRGYRRQATDAGVEVTAEDLIFWLITDLPERTWTPSEIARVIGSDTVTARDTLRSLATDDTIPGDSPIVATGNGAWARYGARR